MVILSCYWLICLQTSCCNQKVMIADSGTAFWFQFGLECAHLYQIQPSAQHKCLNGHAHRIVTAQDLPSAVTVDVYDAAHLFLQMKLARNVNLSIV